MRSFARRRRRGSTCTRNLRSTPTLRIERARRPGARWNFALAIRKLIAKIDAALTRLDDGTYGYCEETGEPISLKRLDARPIATLSVEAQERHERRERFYHNESISDD